MPRAARLRARARRRNAAPLTLTPQRRPSLCAPSVRACALPRAQTVPSYQLLPDPSGATDTCIIKFHAGPPCAHAVGSSARVTHAPRAPPSRPAPPRRALPRGHRPSAQAPHTHPFPGLHNAANAALARTPRRALCDRLSATRYEDVAFKIVNIEWELAHRRGFKFRFERGVLQLYFNFKRHRYRR